MSVHNFQKAVDEMDAANAADPSKTKTENGLEPASLVYARRMTRTLNELYPSASEPLKLAARAQHIERWKVPRDIYPSGRAGYHKWRNDLKQRHAQSAAEILARCGYDDETIARVRDLVAKVNLDTDVEVQALEDVACIVFFQYEAAEFATKHAPEKVARIAAKTWHKMSRHGQAALARLDLPQPIQTLIQTLTDDGKNQPTGT